MTLRPLPIALVLSAPFTVPACIIEHGLGETAESSSIGGDVGSTTDADPSATSGLPPDGSSGPGETTDDPPTDGSTSTDGPTSGTDGDPLCEPQGEWVVWADPFPEPLPGIDATFAAVLAGDCTITTMFSDTPERGQPYQWEIALSCTLSGRVDGDADVVDQPFAPVLMGTSSIPIEQWLLLEPLRPLEMQPLYFRVVLDHWGMGWSRYAVLESDFGPPSTPILDLVSGEYPDPQQGTSWQEDIEAIVGDGSWHDELTITPIDAECSTEPTECEQVPQALELSFPGLDSTVLHPGQGSGLDDDVPLYSFRASVTEAADLSRVRCTDMPLGDYQLAVWANAVLE